MKSSLCRGSHLLVFLNPFLDSEWHQGSHKNWWRVRIRSEGCDLYHEHQHQLLRRWDLPVAHVVLLFLVCLEAVSPLLLLSMPSSPGNTEQQDQSTWSSYTALARCFKVLCLCSWCQLNNPSKTHRAGFWSWESLEGRALCLELEENQQEQVKGGNYWGAPARELRGHASCSISVLSDCLSRTVLCTRSLSQVLSAAGNPSGFV